MCVWGGTEARAGGASAAAGVERTENGEHGDAGARDEGIKSRAGCTSSSDAAQLQQQSRQSSQRSRAETNTAHLLVHGIYGMGLILRFDEAGAICGGERTRQPRRRRHKRRAPEPGTLGSGLECG